MLRWMCFEQYSHEPYVATMRFWLAFIPDRLTAEQQAQIPMRKTQGEAALRVMDDHLAGRDFFVADRLTLADIALYAYTHVAEEGGFALDRHPHVVRWMAAVAALPGHVRMED